MILVDTGPLVALFDPKESDHQRCLDRKDFSVYRLRRGHRHLPVEILG